MISQIQKRPPDFHQAGFNLIATFDGRLLAIVKRLAI
jgi:hypothetical protein